MPKHHKLELSENERQKLVELRDKGEPAYLRERAAALLKIHEGSSPHKVALKGLLKNATPTLSTPGFAATEKTAFKGCLINPVVDANLLFHLNRLKKPRWRSSIPSDRIPDRSMCIKRAGRSAHLETSCRGSTMFPCRVFIKSSHDWVSAINAPEAYVWSPDTDYTEKIARIQQVLEETRQHPQTSVVLYQDEFGFYQQPTVAKDWAQTGTKTPLARQSHQPEQTCYGIGALNPHTGDVVYQQVPSCTVKALHAFYAKICQRYPEKERIYLIQDNRAIHFHANLMEALLPQTVSFKKPTPPNWTGKPSKKIGTTGRTTD